MRHIAIIVFVLLFLQGQNCKAFAPGADHSLLWRISSKEMKKSSYLFGTMHLICPEDYVWTPAMKRSLNASESVCFEMDMDDPSILMDIASGMISNDGVSLQSYFTDAEYKKIEQFISDSLNLNLGQFRQMKPSALQTILAINMIDCTAPISYESNILQEAQKQKKYIVGLEDAREQLSLLDSIEPSSIVKDILYTIDSGSYEKELYNKMASLYKRQNLPALYAYMLSSKNQSDNLDAFLDERNQRWISRMVEKMDQSSVFFAVGAGHLWGENGLVNLLRKEGYTLTPILK